ncbi:MAG: serine/threonine-protein kinase [Sumerlaeia bacterium]
MTPPDELEFPAEYSDPSATMSEDVTRSLHFQRGSVPPRKAPGSMGARPAAESLSRTVWKVLKPGDSAPGGPASLSSGPGYEMLHNVGKGGYGEVWEARQLSLGRPVAIKRLRRDLKADPETSTGNLADALAQFRAEAIIAALAEHPNVVPVHDLGEDESGAPMMAMKLVRGRSWHVAIFEDGRDMDWPDFLARHMAVLRDVCYAVGFAHSRGIVHRDLKAGQVMLGEFGEVQLMDWGLAIWFGDEAEGLEGPALEEDVRELCRELLPTPSSAQSPAGTPAVMAPEQTRFTAEGVGPHTDVFLLGGILYYILTGTYPHNGKTVKETWRMAVLGEVERPEDRAPGRPIPPELADLCMAAMAKCPEERLPGAREFARRLEAYLSGATRRRESAQLAQEATLELERGSQSYAELSKIEDLIGRARRLWADNPALEPLAQKLSLRFGHTALLSGDLRLALYHAESLAPTVERDELLADITAEQQRRSKQAKARRVLTGAVVALSLLVAGGGVFAGVWMRQGQAERLRLQDERITLLEDNEARDRQLRILYEISDLARGADSPEQFLRAAAREMASPWRSRGGSVRIAWDGREYFSTDYRPDPSPLRTPIAGLGGGEGILEVSAEGLTDADRELAEGLARVIGEGLERRASVRAMAAMEQAQANRTDFEAVLTDLTRMGGEAQSPAQLAEEALAAVPGLLQYPTVAVARISLDGRVFEGVGWTEPALAKSFPLRLGGVEIGSLEVGYREFRPIEANGPFLAEEVARLQALADLTALAAARWIDAPQDE